MIMNNHDSEGEKGERIMGIAVYDGYGWVWLIQDSSMHTQLYHL